MSEIERCRRMMFAGHLKVTVSSPLGTDVSFRAERLVRDKPWDGRQWWLWRGREYVGIVNRRGTSFELVLTGRSTLDRVILKAARILLDSLGHGGREGYTITGDDRCGGCKKKLGPDAEFEYGVCTGCKGAKVPA